MATSRICSIPDCGKAVIARGWCSMHYQRWQTHGDPLAIKYASPAREYYEREVLSYDSDDCLFWPFAKAGRGYGVVRSPGRSAYVHRLVCEAVNGSPPTPDHEAAHTCGNGHLGCCNPRHVIWKTPEENAADKLIHGTYFRKDIQKLNDADVLAIRASDKTNSELAEKYGVSAAHVFNIRKAKRRRRLLGDSP